MGDDRNFYGNRDCRVCYTNLFFTQTRTTELSKKVIFQFDLNIGMCSGEVGPEDSFSVSPVVFNDATEEMYVFVKIQISELEDSHLYTFQVNEEWILVESSNEMVVYAYGNTDMTILNPG